MRAGGEKRGNSKDRKRRKFWMLLTFGDGNFTFCVHCTTELDYDSVWQSTRSLRQVRSEFREVEVEPYLGSSLD